MDAIASPEQARIGVLVIAWVIVALTLTLWRNAVLRCISPQRKRQRHNHQHSDTSLFWTSNGDHGRDTPVARVGQTILIYGYE